jgi:hypothetical protein
MATHRELMPTCADWLDELRSAFGSESINDSIRAGMRGKPTFYAAEGGHELGSRETLDPGLNAHVFDAASLDDIAALVDAKKAQQSRSIG